MIQTKNSPSIKHLSYTYVRRVFRKKEKVIREGMQMISLDQVVLKMAEEIEKAKQAEGDSQVREHVRAIHLLADLVLEEPAKKEEEPNISEMEMRQMMGSRTQPEPKPEVSQGEDKYGQSTSDSLLDF